MFADSPLLFNRRRVRSLSSNHAAHQTPKNPQEFPIIVVLCRRRRHASTSSSLLPSGLPRRFHRYHGVRVADPYRWLEDLESDEVQDFIDEQSQLTETVFAVCDLRDKLRRRMMKWYYYGAPFKRGNRYFYFHNSGLQEEEEEVLFVQSDLNGEAEVVLDINGLNEDEEMSLFGAWVGRDGEYLAYGLHVGWE